MSDVSTILKAIENGDPAASEDLLPAVYKELRKLAQARMANEPPGQTLQATALVHEAFMRLVDHPDPQNWNSKGHFFAAAAHAMRRILVENARRRKTLRRGGDRMRIIVDQIDFEDPGDPALLTALDSCLENLARENEVIAEVVNLRFFAGLTIEQTASALEISVRTANRHWAYARAWLYSELSEGIDAGAG